MILQSSDTRLVLSLSDLPDTVKHCQVSGKTFDAPKRIAGQLYCFWTTVSSRLFRGQANGAKIIRPLNTRHRIMLRVALCRFSLNHARFGLSRYDLRYLETDRFKECSNVLNSIWSELHKSSVVSSLVLDKLKAAPPCSFCNG